MRMTQLSPNHQTPNHKSSKATEGQLQNERLMKDIHHDLRQALEADGYRVRYPIKDCPVLLVDDFVIVGDNLESAVGNIINVTAALDKNDFDEAKQIGEIVRRSEERRVGNGCRCRVG